MSRHKLPLPCFRLHHDFVAQGRSDQKGGIFPGEGDKEEQGPGTGPCAKGPFSKGTYSVRSTYDVVECWHLQLVIGQCWKLGCGPGLWSVVGLVALWSRALPCVGHNMSCVFCGGSCHQAAVM